MPILQTLWQERLMISKARFLREQPHLEHLHENKNLGVFQIDGPSARNARDDRVDERLPGQRIMIAYFELDLVLLRACGGSSPMRLYTNRYMYHRGPRTRKSESECCSRNSFNTRCASDLISGTFATHVFVTGVRRCVYLCQDRPTVSDKAIAFRILYTAKKEYGDRLTSCALRRSFLRSRCA